MPTIYNITDQLPKGTGQYPTRRETDITDLVIHHSAADPRFGPHDFADWHINTNGWPGIGYHYVIMPDGTIYQTNHHQTASYHCGGHNRYTLGICLAGDFEQYTPPKVQKEALVWLLKKLRKELPNAIFINGHRDYKSTSCPGQYLDVEEIRARVMKKNSGAWVFGVLVGLGVVGAVVLAVFAW